MTVLKKNQSIGLIALSNGLNPKMEDTLRNLEACLNEMQVLCVWPEKMYQGTTVFHASDEERAKLLMDYYQNDRIQAIFDLSGGDLANGILPFLDYDVIRAHPKPFFGYSDLSVVLNAIYVQTDRPTYLYQLRHLVGPYAPLQQKMFEETLLEGNDSLFNFEMNWIQGNQMCGEVVGGNIRCFLKLAGTPYLPDFKGKILLLESFSGDASKMATYLNQYKQMGAFDQIEGLILGCFTEMEQKAIQPDILTLVREIVGNPSLPIIKTHQVGHGADSRGVMIGRKLTLKR